MAYELLFSSQRLMRIFCGKLLNKTVFSFCLTFQIYFPPSKFIPSYLLNSELPQSASISSPSACTEETEVIMIDSSQLCYKDISASPFRASPWFGETPLGQRESCCGEISRCSLLKLLTRLQRGQNIFSGC